MDFYLNTKFKNKFLCFYREQERENVDFNSMPFTSPVRAPARQISLFSPYEETMHKVISVPEKLATTTTTTLPISPLSPVLDAPTTSALRFLSPLRSPSSSSKNPRKRPIMAPLSPMRSPSSRAAKQINIGKKARSRWTDDETKILLEVYKLWAQKLRKNKKKAIWEKIHKQYDCKCRQK